MREEPDKASSTADYATRFSGETGQWFLRVQAEGTRLLMGNVRGRYLLDAGGAHGQNVETCLSAGARVCILGSPGVTTKRLDPYLQRGDIDFSEGSLLKIPFPDRSFDGVLLYRMLAHLTQWEQVIAECARVSRVFVLVDYPRLWSANLFSSVFFRAKKHLEKNTRPFRIFEDAQIRKTFRRHHFVPKGCFGQYVFPMALHRALHCPRGSQILETGMRRLGVSRYAGSPVLSRFDRVEQKQD